MSRVTRIPAAKAGALSGSELLDYMASGKPKSQAQAYDEMVVEMNKGLRPEVETNPVAYE